MWVRKESDIWQECKSVEQKDKNVASDSEDIGNNIVVPNLEKSDVVSLLRPEILKNLFLCDHFLIIYLLLINY